MIEKGILLLGYFLLSSLCVTGMVTLMGVVVWVGMDIVGKKCGEGIAFVLMLASVVAGVTIAAFIYDPFIKANAKARAQEAAQADE